MPLFPPFGSPQKMTNPINSMEQLRLKMGKTVNCFFLMQRKVCLMIIVKKRKIQSLEQAYPTLYSLRVRTEKFVTYFMTSLEIERVRILWRQFLQTLFLYLTGSWTSSSLGLQWKYSKNIQNSQSEIKQNSFFLQIFSASKAPTWRWLPCY